MEDLNTAYTQKQAMDVQTGAESQIEQNAYTPSETVTGQGYGYQYEPQHVCPLCHRCRYCGQPEPQPYYPYYPYLPATPTYSPWGGFNNGIQGTGLGDLQGYNTNVCNT
jgi:hypothetical protein